MSETRSGLIALPVRSWNARISCSASDVKSNDTKMAARKEIGELMQDHQAALIAASKIIAARTTAGHVHGDDALAKEIVRLASAILVEMRREKLAAGSQTRG